MTTKVEKLASGGLRIQFPGAELLPSRGTTAEKPKFRIGWYLKGSSVSSASIRYRCFHFARVLDQDFENLFFSRYQDLKNDIDDLDAIIIVKRLDRYTIDLAALARHLGKPLFLDLCDDLANPKDPTLDYPYYALTALLAAAPSLAGITVPSAEMAVRVEKYLKDNGLSGPACHVIPDIAETRELFVATERFIRRVTGVPPSPDVPDGVAAVARPTDSLRRIIWFGNYGGSHSNFGMFSLKPVFKHLREFNRTCPIELVIVSNSVTIYETLVAGCNFPTRYVPWTPSAIYDELDRADAALLMTGYDEFCTVKSSNRILQALAASVPVITEKAPALVEFEEVIFTGRFLRNLEECVGSKRDTTVPPRLALAEPILLRYTPERLSALWSNLLKQAIGRSLVLRSAKSRSGILMVLDVGDDPDYALDAILMLNRTVGRDGGLLVSIDLLENDLVFRRILLRAKALPMFFSGRLKGLEGQMIGWSAVALGNPESTNGRLISAVARQVGMEILTHADLAQDELERFASSSGRQALIDQSVTPGPYPERTDLDGSVEWAFVIHAKGRGWILDAICREIGSRQTGSWTVVDHAAPPPASRNLFFSHFSLLDLFDNKYPDTLEASKIFVWYTHPRDEDANAIERNLHLFNKATRIIFTCQSNRELWIDRGLDPKKAVVVLGAADPALFQRHERGGGVVGLSSSFYERKNPDLMLDIVKALPHRDFVLLGRNWNRYARFEELLSQPNFTYLTRPYREYPRIYSSFDVFLSISNLEGGPIPLIEAMMCNAVPVASNTGFAPDLIDHGRNGFLFETRDGAERVSTLIEQAFDLDGDVRKTVEQYSWDRFSAEIVGLAR
ncbi:glycosyltransferase involved in cell wall biosynthesis [Sphingobium sp. B2D3A]|uniref:glycosyltransferase family 4 protein n=1 Tax=unclassified Sphingobium TaxID=2611147 RepID=UPI002224654D|nr:MULTISPECIES: glycosyltransferase family 4 protein [unclassified Sphingobium]MCW2338502.1 glycosyltransferase involved in cell wall biosynthesis [Sphingobium sp. B2D3A]MCW2384960.1 glycosyltransferase involved in cell wall biosynthesis [Sphingobium sp. B2D3D]